MFRKKKKKRVTKQSPSTPCRSNGDPVPSLVQGRIGDNYVLKDPKEQLRSHMS